MASTHGTNYEDYIKITADAFNDVTSGIYNLKILGSMTWNGYPPVTSEEITIMLVYYNRLVGDDFNFEVTPNSNADPSITVFDLN